MGPRMTPKMALLKFTRKEGRRRMGELQEYKEVRIMVEDVIKNNSKIRQALELNNSISVDKLAKTSVFNVNAESKPYDEWESIQRELALYPREANNKEDGYNPMVGYNPSKKRQTPNETSYKSIKSIRIGINTSTVLFPAL